MKWIRRGIVVVVIGAIVVAIAWSFVPRPIFVDVATVRCGSFTATVDAEGMTRVKDRYVVSAPVAGVMRRVELRAGDRVEAGAIVARLGEVEPPLMDAQSRAQARARLAAAQAAERQAIAGVERARVARELAERELGRVRGLAEKGVVGTQAIDAAEVDARVRRRDEDSAGFAARVAQHEVQLAEATLARGGANAGREVIEVRSPVAGRVLRLLRESEGVVAAGTPLVEVADPATLEIVVQALTADAVGIVPGAPVSVERWGGPPLKGKVRLVEPGGFTKVSALGIEEQRVNVVVDLDEPAPALGDGYRVEARIAVWHGEEVVQVPASALWRDGESWAVFVWGEGGKARVRRVEVGRRSGMDAQVVKGIGEGEVVLLHPGDAVAEGVAIARR